MERKTLFRMNSFHLGQCLSLGEYKCTWRIVEKIKFASKEIFLIGFYSTINETQLVTVRIACMKCKGHGRDQRRINFCFITSVDTTWHGLGGKDDFQILHCKTLSRFFPVFLISVLLYLQYHLRDCSKFITFFFNSFLDGSWCWNKSQRTGKRLLNVSFIATGKYFIHWILIVSYMLRLLLSSLQSNSA